MKVSMGSTGKTSGRSGNTPSASHGKHAALKGLENFWAAVAPAASTITYAGAE